MKRMLLETFRKHMVRDGHLRYRYVLLFSLSGIGLVLMDLKLWETGWLYIAGLSIAAFGGYAAQAYILKIRPFEEPPYPESWLDERKSAMKDELDKGLKRDPS